MRRLTFLLVSVLLAACEAGTLRVLPAEDWDSESPGSQVSSAEFREISRAVGKAARTECLRQSGNRNCDFTIMVDLNPRAPENAFQTLDDDGQPVIIFTQTMINSAKNADELAFVMGHEAAHHVLGHLARQSNNSQESAVIFGDLARLDGGDDADVEAWQKLGAQVGVQAYVKDFELEADQLGTVITYRAGYNPLVGAVYFNRIPDPGDKFLGTHPPNAQRVQIVQETARQLGLTP